jgi:thymidine phosphorylase
LKHREAPLVAVATSGGRFNTMEGLVGNYFSINAPEAGKVTKVNKDEIIIKGKSGQLHRQSLYDNYPLNDKTSFINSIPQVKVGDEVTKD